MRVQPAVDTFEFDIENNIYFVRADRELTLQHYLGLYKEQSVRAVGKVIARINAIKTVDNIEYEVEFGNLTGKLVKMIENILNEYNLINDKHKFFFVDKFYETDFKKTSPGGLQRSKIFDLTEVIGNDEIPKPESLAKLLKNLTWV